MIHVQRSNMSSEERILQQIVKARDAIRKKHRMLKRGKEAIETSMKEVFKPIITPFQEMADRTPAQPNTRKEEVPSIKQELSVEDEEEEASTMTGEDDLISFQSASEHTNPSFTTSSPIVHKETDNLSKYLKMLSSNQTSTLDTVYGMRSLTMDWRLATNQSVSLTIQFT